MSSMPGQLSQAAANTAFVAKGDELFNAPMGGDFKLFTDVQPCDGSYFENDIAGAAPAVREIFGSRRFGTFRLLANRARVRRWGPDAIEIPALDVMKNKSGSITRRLTNYLSQSAANIYDKPATDFLLSNPSGIDGVSLLNDAHPHAPDGVTWDNKTTAAYSAAEHKTAVSNISGRRAENGEPMNLYPTHVFVGPALEQLARDLCGNPMRLVLAGTAAEVSSGAVAATALPNTWMSKQITPIVLTRMANGTNDNDFIYMDLSKPGVRPVYLGEAIKPTAVVIDDPKSEPMAQRSCHQYYVEAQAALLGGLPHILYGRLS